MSKSVHKQTVGNTVSKKDDNKRHYMWVKESPGKVRRLVEG